MKRLAPVLALLAALALALALPAVAATPKSGVFAGKGTFKSGDGEKRKATVKLTVKSGKITKAYLKAGFAQFPNKITFEKPIKVKKSGKFSGRRKFGFGHYILKGRFTKPGKAKGTIEITHPDVVASFPKTKFKVKRKG